MPMKIKINRLLSFAEFSNGPLSYLVVEQADDPERETEDGTIGLEDLDAIQTELETLLVTVVRRQRVLDSQSSALISAHEEKRPKERKSAPSSKVRESFQSQNVFLI